MTKVSDRRFPGNSLSRKGQGGRKADRIVRLARFLKDYKKQVILGPIFKLMEAIFEVIVPVVMASLIDVGIQNGDRGISSKWAA